MTSSTDQAALDPHAPWDAPTADDIFGVARYLAEAVGHGDISEDDGEIALLDWAGPDCHVLERADMRLAANPETEQLLRAALSRAA